MLLRSAPSRRPLVRALVRALVAGAALALASCGGAEDGDLDDLGAAGPGPDDGTKEGPSTGTPPSVGDDAGPGGADGDGGRAEATDGGDAGPPPPPEPDFDAVPWEQGGDVGFGVARKDTGNPRGDSAAIFYGGYEARLDAAKAWARELYRADLRARGVRFLYAVQGPATVQYTGLEIGNTNLLAHLLPRVGDRTKFILVLGHSSGSYVAQEMLRQVAGTFDPQNKAAGRLVYFNLDGGRAGFTDAAAAKMRKVYWVSPRDVAKGTGGFNDGSMQSAGSQYAALGGLLRYDASQAGCNAGATGCVHNSLVITRPHSPARARPDVDYENFTGRPVTTAYLLAKAAEAGLVAAAP